MSSTCRWIPKDVFPDSQVTALQEVHVLSTVLIVCITKNREVASPGKPGRGAVAAQAQVHAEHIRAQTGTNKYQCDNCTPLILKVRYACVDHRSAMDLSFPSAHTFGDLSASHNYPGPIKVGGNGITVIGNADLRSLTEDQNRITEREDEKKRMECHQALRTCNYEEFKNINPPRAPNTCRWALNHVQYQNWLQTDHDDLLWISADPGCGKSVLSKALVDDIPGPVQVSVCYFFFKDNQQQASINTALCAVLHQLFSHEPDLLRFALPLWKRDGGHLVQQSHTLWRLFLKAAGFAKRPVVCVLDALDECVETDRRILIELLCNFHRAASSNDHETALKFIATSRPYDSVHRWFRDAITGCPTIWLRGDEENDTINKEINLVIASQVSKLALEFRLKEDSRVRLQGSLENMSHRTYLWLHLTLDIIRNKFRHSLNPNKVKIEDLMLPKTVEAAYEALLARVENQHRERVKKILLIIIGAQRPFSLDEMFLALSIAFPEEDQAPSMEDFDRDVFAVQIRDWCGLFIFVTDSKLFLIHQTAKEFLLAQEHPGALAQYRASGLAILAPLMNKVVPTSAALSTPFVDDIFHPAWKSCLTSDQVEYEMACLCVEYLNLDIEKGILDADYGHKAGMTIHDQIDRGCSIRNWTEAPATTRLYVYCADHWGSHLQDKAISTKRSLFNKILRLYEQPEAKNLFPRWGSISESLIHDFMWYLERESDIARPGVGHARQMLFQRSRPGFGLASDDSRKGRRAILGPPLLAQHLMANNGHTTVLKHLSETSQVDWEVKDATGQTALIYATRKGHIGTVEFIVGQNANIYTKTVYSESALGIAVEEEDIHMVETLLRTKSHVNEVHACKKKALEIAAELGHLSLVEMLLAAGASLDCCALHLASRECHDLVVSFLLFKGANVNKFDNRRRTPLHAAIDSLPSNATPGKQKIEKIVHILIEANADVNLCQQDDGVHALELAAEHGSEAIAQILIDAGADVNAFSTYGTALHAVIGLKIWHSLDQAIIGSVVRVLLKAGADINACGPGGNALELASKRGAAGVVNMLLKAGADIRAGGQHGTALELASGCGSAEVVQSLIDAGADVTTSGPQGTALELASGCGSAEVVQVLLDSIAKLSVVARSRACYEALKIALGEKKVSSEYSRITRLLLQAATNVPDRDSWRSLLNAAIVKGEVHAIQILLARIADVQDPVAIGRASLMEVYKADEELVWVATQQHPIDWVAARKTTLLLSSIFDDQNCYHSLKCKYSFGSSADGVRLLLERISRYKSEWWRQGVDFKNGRFQRTQGGWVYVKINRLEVTLRTD